MRVLVTGATGYIGGRLIPRLLEQGHRVRVLVRDAARVRDRPWHDAVEIVQGDLLDAHSLIGALDDMDVAYYLVHAMTAGHDFAQRDRTAARNFIAAAGHLRHVIYLGGLQPPPEAQGVSRHLASRREVGELLRAQLPTTELRAGPIIGSGSASFEMVRYLTERLPVMVTPRWVNNRCDPIAIRDVLAYLLASLDRQPLGVVEIGSGALTFRQMMLTYARLRKLPRVIIALPVLAPGLAARWVGAVTPISNRLAVPLIEGMVHSLVVPDQRARELFPDIHPVSYELAVSYALDRLEKGQVETRWSDALNTGEVFQLQDRQGLIREVRVQRTPVAAAQVFATISAVGGDRGWPAWNWAWKLRGFLDKLVGGPGLRRGRRDPVHLLVGDSVDFWRVEAIETNRMLRLRAEMRLPGSAWLQWEIEPTPEGSELVQTALFAPRGFFGAVYWYSLYPLHRLIFTDMIRKLARQARLDAHQADAATPSLPSSQ